jgi:hypothetical protein
MVVHHAEDIRMCLPSVSLVHETPSFQSHIELESSSRLRGRAYGSVSFVECQDVLINILCLD